MEEFSIEKARAEIRKALNLDVMRAILGDKDGNIYVPGQPGMLYVRLPSSDGKYTVPTTARVGGTFSVQPGAPVLLKRDADGALSVFSADYAAQMQSGYDPRANNAADLNIYGFLSQRQIATLRCQPVPGALAVSVKAWVFVDAEGRLHEFEGDTIALQAPSTSGEHYLAAVFLGTLGLEVHYSTAKPVADDLDSEDVQECLDKRSPLAVPIAVWRLVSGMTELPDSALYYDFRQFVNIPAPRHNYSAQTAPTTSDDATRGYSAGSLWFDLGTQRAWLCLNNSPGAAVWKDIGGSSSASSPTTTHGDIIVRGPTADARLPIGPDGAFLRVDTTAPLKVDWQPSVRALTSRSVAQRVLLAELTLSDPQHTIDIPNLASAYDGLYIEARLSTSATSVQSCSLYLNGDFTASSYVATWHEVTDTQHTYGSGSQPAKAGLPSASGSGGMYAYFEGRLMDYGTAGAQKALSTCWRLAHSGTQVARDEIVRWTNTAGVTRVTFRMDDLSYAFAAGSRVRVYGMKTAPLELLIPAASDVSVEQKVLIASVSLTSPANDMLVAGIPPDYDTLMIDIGAATTHTSWTGGVLRLNDAPPSAYSRALHSQDGTGHAVFQNLTNASVIYLPPQSINAGMRALLQIQIPDYANTARHKLIITRGSALYPNAFQSLETARWGDTAAIHTVRFLVENPSHNLSAGSWMRVYGVKTGPLVVSVPNLASFSLVDTGAFHFGARDVDGTWRFVRSGNNLVVQRREGGVWVDKHTFMP